MEKVLVTGGLGYIGSHTAVVLAQAGYEVEIVDNLSNSDLRALGRISELAGREVKFHRLDLLDEKATDRLFEETKPDGVIHFAGLKAVGESVSDPQRYYQVNLGSTLSLTKAMAAHGCRTLVFSSSATVYAENPVQPLPESATLGAANPYGRTKLMIEEILADLYHADPRWQIAALRYFNPVGAHPSGRIGENPRGIPNNLVPFLTQVATGQREYLAVFGNDYPTPDGTGVRDYIHVMDLAEAHQVALAYLTKHGGHHTWNLGSGQGHSVLQVIQAFEEANQIAIPYQIAPRRPGDIALYYADPSLARAELGWHTTRSLHDMCRDAWSWQRNNPDGYNS